MEGHGWVATESKCEVSGATSWVVRRGSGSDTGRGGRRQPDGMGTSPVPAEHCIARRKLLPRFRRWRLVLRIRGHSPSSFPCRRIGVRCVVPLCDWAGRSGEEPDPAPKSRLCLATHRASAQARLVKYCSSIMKDPRSEAWATQSATTR